MDEYLSGETVLGEYEYVHTCMKFDEDVIFTLMHADSVKQAYLRTVSLVAFVFRIDFNICICVL